MAAETRPERYNGTAVDTCMLMKQALIRGLTARESAARVRTYLANEARRRSGMGTFTPASRRQLRDELRTFQAALAAALRMVEALAPQGPADTGHPSGGERGA